MRGDHRAPDVRAILLTGPPPHARGSPRTACFPRSPARPTPACAGITRHRCAPATATQVHPRMRGDHGAPGAAPCGASGPPPHARGSPVGPRCCSRSARPTPACAGITLGLRCRRWRAGAHPRMRGDHGIDLVIMDVPTGPPPHARGSHDRGAAAGVGPGPTPACAGITATLSAASQPTAAHPRMRGDHPCVNATHRSATGPPPHARGSLSDGVPERERARPTPACAGITG